MSTDREDTAGDGPAKVDLAEVARLVDALERDLGKVREGASGVETLRSEVEQLRTALQAEGPAEPGVHAGLESIRDLLHRAGDELLEDAVKVSEYVTRIGRMLGL
ncbi:MAG: hypothetical protein IT515_12875 [Burkholderiales bacterium]|nr:hypothetical protein [Burkholderiales bacterium]